MTASPVTDNEFIIYLLPAERAEWREEKGDLTYAAFYLEVKAGKRKPIKIPAAAYKGKHKYCIVKFYLTNEQAAALTADAERRGISVSKAVRADVFRLPKSTQPPRAQRLRLDYPVADDVRDALAIVRATYPHTEQMSETRAYGEISGILIKEAAKALL